MASPDFDCKDCTISTLDTRQYYMVLDPVWVSAGMTTEFGNGMLCIDCLEKRLGRRLKIEDFTWAPINEMFFAIFGTERFE